MKLVVGLGNPGNEYKNTRHNIGFMFIDNYLGSVKWSKKFNGLYYEAIINEEKYIFLKPQSYMNLSGGVVLSYVKFFKIDYSDILVIQDDLDLPFAKFKLKINSSDGGHNGIKDIIKALDSNSFSRLKIGISNNKNIDTKDYVLANFSSTELKLLNDIQSSVNEIIEDFSQFTIQELMNKYN